jgi:REP element-mobilizing transposase RayT
MALFRDDQDANVFLARVRKAAKVAECIVWAYTLMTNHFHLVLRASSEQLSRFMHHLQRLYSRYHNRRWKLRGHAFEGPYGAVRLGSPGARTTALAYVFMNPVAAGLTARPEDWSWTSYRSYMGIGPSRLPLNVLPLLAELAGDPATARRQMLEAVHREGVRIGRKGFTEPTAVDVHVNQFEWLLDCARDRAAALGEWDPLYLAIEWAGRVGVLRSAISRVLGGPLGQARRAELSRFRKWRSSLSDARCFALP